MKRPTVRQTHAICDSLNARAVLVIALSKDEETMTTTPSATNSAGPPPPTMPAPASNPETLVREALDDFALVIGGAAAIHHLDDDLVWTVMKRLDRIRVRLLRDLKGLAPRDEFELNPAWPPRIHAAVDEFLVRNRMGMGE